MKFYVADGRARARPRRSSTAAARRTPSGRRSTTRGRPRTRTRSRCTSRLANRTLPDGWADALPTWPTEKDGKPNAVSTRKASGEVLTKLAPVLPELWGGSADLAESNNTTMEGEPSFVPAEYQTKMWPGGPYGRTLHFGIREHAMGAILNGINVHGGTRAYGGTFLVFSDYMRPPVRLAALMDLPSIFVWTHDSIGLGGDGPTHQPIEHLASLRAIPGLDVVRPADPNETAACWRRILEKTDGPAGLALSRQNLPVLDPVQTADAGKGAYILEEASSGRAKVIIIATGSEVVAGTRGPRGPRGRGHAHAGRVDAVRRVVRGAARVRTGRKFCRPRSRRASASRRPSSRAGASTSARPARWCPSSTSARAPKVTSCSSSSASPPTAWSPPPIPRCNTPEPEEIPHDRRTCRSVRPGRLDLAGRHQPRAPAHRQPEGPDRQQARRRRHQQPDDLPEGAREGRRLRRPGHATSRRARSTSTRRSAS